MPGSEPRRAAPPGTIASVTQRPIRRQAPSRAAQTPAASTPAPARRPAAPAPHEVRIIGGRLRRSRLPVLDAPGLRPTPDRVRETLFNWLGQDLSGWSVLDAYAGSGALGFEAASRGASTVVMLERDARLAASLRAVRERLKVGGVTVEAVDALTWMRNGAAASFSLVLLDPPFADDPRPALTLASRLLVPGGWLYLEAGAPITESDAAGLGLSLHRAARAGAVHYHLLRRADG